MSESELKDLRRLSVADLDLLFHLWSLLALCEVREAERLKVTPTRYMAAKDRHLALHGHNFSVGCCRNGAHRPRFELDRARGLSQTTYNDAWKERWLQPVD